VNLYDEIARVAYELWERSGRVSGRELDNWLEAERIVLAMHASQEIEEPEEATKKARASKKAASRVRKEAKKTTKKTISRKKKVR
jgi:hypothetical protein